MANWYKDYTKTPVNITKLELEIIADGLTPNLVGSVDDYSGSDNLRITFDAEVTGGELTTLDATVAAHDGAAATYYTIYCYDCGCSQGKRALAVLTACPVCSGTDIQTAYHKDNLDATSDPTVNDDGTAGYCTGSHWINVTTDVALICLDNTTGAAVWKQISDAVLKSLFDANTIQKADSDDTPLALTVPEQTLLGRITAGNIDALTVAQVKTLLGATEREFMVNCFSYVQTGSEWYPQLEGAILDFDNSGDLFLPLPFLKIGDKITSYKIVGDINKEGGDTVTLDCKLVRVNKADPLTTTDIAGGAIVQVTADGNFDVEAVLSAQETVATDKQYLLLIQGVTSGVSENEFIKVIGAEVKVDRL